MTAADRFGLTVDDAIDQAIDAARLATAAADHTNTDATDLNRYIDALSALSAAWSEIAHLLYAVDAAEAAAGDGWYAIPAETAAEMLALAAEKGARTYEDDLRRLHDLADLVVNTLTPDDV